MTNMQLIPKIDDDLIGKVVTFNCDFDNDDGGRGCQLYHLKVDCVDWNNGLISGDIMEKLQISGYARISIDMTGFLEDGALIMTEQQYREYKKTAKKINNTSMAFSREIPELSDFSIGPTPEGNHGYLIPIEKKHEILIEYGSMRAF